MRLLDAEIGRGLAGLILIGLRLLSAPGTSALVFVCILGGRLVRRLLSVTPAAVCRWLPAANRSVSSLLLLDVGEHHGGPGWRNIMHRRMRSSVAPAAQRCIGWQADLRRLRQRRRISTGDRGAAGDRPRLATATSTAAPVKTRSLLRCGEPPSHQSPTRRSRLKPLPDHWGRTVK